MADWGRATLNLSAQQAEALDRALDAYIASELTDPNLPHLIAVRAKLAAAFDQTQLSTEDR